MSIFLKSIKRVCGCKCLILHHYFLFFLYLNILVYIVFFFWFLVHWKVLFSGSFYKLCRWKIMVEKTFGLLAFFICLTYNCHKFIIFEFQKAFRSIKALYLNFLRKVLKFKLLTMPNQPIKI